MATYRVLIADHSEEFAADLADSLNDICHVTTCTNGDDALALLRKERFHLLILDIALPQLDGITLLEIARNEEVFCQTLALTVHKSSYILSRLSVLGVSYLMCKPCRISAVKKRALDLLQESNAQYSNHQDHRKAVTELLIQLGMSPQRRGYDCTREAVLCLLEDRRLSMTKELYPNVAERCSGNAKQVEKAIRDAVEKAWQHRDETVWPSYFRPCADGTISKPSNAIFLGRVAEAVYLADP